MFYFWELDISDWFMFQYEMNYLKKVILPHRLNKTKKQHMPIVSVYEKTGETSYKSKFNIYDFRRREGAKAAEFIHTTGNCHVNNEVLKLDKEGIFQENPNFLDVKLFFNIEYPDRRIEVMARHISEYVSYKPPF